MKSERQCCVPGGQEGNLLSNEQNVHFFPSTLQVRWNASPCPEPPRAAFELGACQAPAGMDLVANSPSWPIAGTVKLRKDELCALSRTELQALAKEHGIKANQKTDVLIREVMAKLEAAAAEGRSLPQAELGTTLMFGEMETETATLNADVPAEDVETSAAAAVEDAAASAETVLSAAVSAAVSAAFDAAVVSAEAELAAETANAAETAGAVDAEMDEVEVNADTSVQACTEVDAQTSASVGENAVEAVTAGVQESQPNTPPLFTIAYHHHPLASHRIPPLPGHAGTLSPAERHGGMEGFSSHGDHLLHRPAESR